MRHIVVTGANKGIGLAVVRRLLTEHDDTFVHLGSRSATNGKAAVDGLVSGDGDLAGRVRLVVLDVASDESVEAARASVVGEAGAKGIHCLVNNAGMHPGNSGASLSEVLGTNYYGVSRVTRAFLPHLSPGGRVVTVSSASGPMFVQGCEPDMVNFFINKDVTVSEVDGMADKCVNISNGPKPAQAFKKQGLGSGEYYGLSKALVNSFTIATARGHPDLNITACTPGFIETDLTRYHREKNGKTAEELGMKTPHEGAMVVVRLAAEDPPGRSGAFYGSDAKRSPMHAYRSPGDAEYISD